MKHTLSIIILTYNEERHIGPCMRSVAFADEIVVIDDASTDKTVAIARKLGATVYKRKLDDFASQRNFALTKAKGEWVLFVDADERVTPQLQKEIKQAINQDAVVYKIPRKNHIFGKFFSFTNWYPDFQTRLIKVGKAHFDRTVHEQVVTDEIVGQLVHEFVHYNYDNVDQFISKNFGVYASLEAGRLVKSGYVFAFSDLVEKPVAEFLSRFFAGRGYKDGIHGFIASILVAIAVFITYVKVWELQGSKDQSVSLLALGNKLESSHENTSYWLRKSRIDAEKNAIKRFFLKIIT